MADMIVSMRRNCHWVKENGNKRCPELRRWVPSEGRRLVVVRTGGSLSTHVCLWVGRKKSVGPSSGVALTQSKTGAASRTYFVSNDSSHKFIHFSTFYSILLFSLPTLFESTNQRFPICLWLHDGCCAKNLMSRDPPLHLMDLWSDKQRHIDLNKIKTIWTLPAPPRLGCFANFSFVQFKVESKTRPRWINIVSKLHYLRKVVSIYFSSFPSHTSTNLLTLLQTSCSWAFYADCFTLVVFWTNERKQKAIGLLSACNTALTQSNLHLYNS